MKRALTQSVLCWLALTIPALAQGPASVAGTVHDAAGEPQIGVLVQLLTPDNIVLAAAYSDENGHYDLQAASAGTFQVRASAAMFLPAIRQNIPLNLGSHTLLDLTLNTLTEAFQWLPAHPRTDKDAADDWKWTLRSPANRPVLRDFDPTIILASGGSDKAHVSSHDSQAQAEVMNSTSSFASSGVHQIITLEHTSLHRHDYMFRGDVASQGGQSASATVSTSFQEGPGQTIHMAGNYQWHSDLQMGSGAGPNASNGTVMGSAIARVAQTSELGPDLTLETGSELQQIGWANRVTQAHPFATLLFTPNDQTIVSYALATSPGFTRADDTQQTIERTPLAAPSSHGLALEHGLHQELSWSHDTGQTIVTTAVFHDAVDNPILQGIATPGAIESANLPAGYDSASGLLREAGASFTTEGVELTLDHEFTSHPLGIREAAVSLVDAGAVTLVSGPLRGIPMSRIRNGQLASLTLRGVIAPTRTRWSADYGAESAGVLLALTPFDLDGPSPYCNITVRQPLHGSNLEAVVEVRNLLAQGYHPFLADDGETIYFMQIPRSLQGGLVFSF